MVDRFARFSLAISKIYRHWHQIAGAVMETYGLKSSCALYLITLNRHPQGITAARLSEICDRNKADVSRAAAELEKKGFLVKEGAPYRSLLHLTAEGEELAKALCEQAGKAVEAGSKGILPEQRALFYEKLEQIAVNLEKMSREGIPNGEQKIGEEEK